MLVKSKLNSIETYYLKHWLTWKYVMKNLIQLWRRKNIYEKMKENVRNASEKQENVRLNSANLKN